MPSIEEFTLVNGVWLRSGATGSPPPTTTLKRSRLYGARARHNAIVAPPGGQWPDPPDYPIQTWESLYVSGDTVPQTMARITTQGNMLQLPADTFLEVDLLPRMVNELVLYFPKIRGIRGNGSATSGFKAIAGRTAEHNTFMRLMDGRNGQNVFDGFSIIGSEQLPADHGRGGVHPADQSGLILYYGRNAYFRDFNSSGHQGSWNSPQPEGGETFDRNFYKDIDTKSYGSSSSGYDRNGKLTGGSPTGLNNSTNVEMYDEYHHDSFVSGLTASFTGSYTSASAASSGWKLVRCRIHRNAGWNIFSRDGWNYGTGGKGFAGVNLENVLGEVLIDHCDFIMNMQVGAWSVGEMSIVNYLSDNKQISVIEPTWTPKHAKMGGCFVMAMSPDYPGGSGIPNKQVTVPTLVKGGRELNPVFTANAPTTTPLKRPDGQYVDPTRDFVVIGVDRRP
jgi:hypothetical protein